MLKKRWMALFLSVLLLLPCSASLASEQEMRGIWVATVSNIDFPSPSAKGNAQAQQAEITNMLDQFQAAGPNTVFFQVRPKADALYRSNIEPWSDVLTGTSGKDPGYDPLAFFIDEAHKRGMELHAWLNPYRVTMANTDVSTLAENHVAKTHPEWLITYNNSLYLNPALPEVRDYITSVVLDIVNNYDVDGIHFDDYFYPNGYPLTEGDGDGAEADARRQNVNLLVQQVHDAIKGADASVEFGISPSGIYKNTDTIRGSQSYYTVYADTLAWVQNGWVDYIAPQVYWETTHATAAYETVAKYWNEAVAGTGVTLYLGEALYKEQVAAEIDDHIAISRNLSNVSGNIFYNTSSFLNNVGGGKDLLTAVYQAGGSTQTPQESQTEETKPEETKPEPKPPVTAQALPSSVTVLVNGVAEDFETYNINDYTYFKLRDIAYAVQNTDKQFNTLWDASANTITLALQTPYVPAGGELSKSGTSGTKTAVESDVTVLVDGKKVSCESYNIDGYTYFKLRDVAQAVDFGVSWSDATQTIGIVTLVGYEQ